MPAASRSDQFASGSQSHNFVLDQVGSDEGGPSSVQGVISLSMIRQALGGLVTNAQRRVPSETEHQRRFERLSKRSSRTDRTAGSFAEERDSHCVNELFNTVVSPSAFKSQRLSLRSNGFAQISYGNPDKSWTQIGGLK